MTKYPDYKLTEEQLASLARISQRWEQKVSDLLAHAHPEVGSPKTACLMVPVGKDLTQPTMWIGIERDGYTHT